MSTTWVTRCPKCATAFRLNHQQLTAAAGSVRCGSCLKVFKAQEHFVTGSAPTPEELLPAKPAQAPTPPPVQQAVAAPEPKTEEPEFSAAFSSLDEAPERDHFEPTEAPGHPQPSADESWAEAMLEEMEQEQAPQPGAPPQPSSNQATTDPTASPTSNPSEPNQTQAPTAEKSREQETDKSASEQQQWLQDLEHDPINLQEERSHSGRRLAAWIVLNLLAGLLLFGQYAYYNFDQFARDDRWRPSYAQACSFLDCELPGIQDLRQVKSGNLIVRSHEKYKQALTVDAVIYNQASHPQPFPDIELLFTDLEGAAVASRIFTADEYLGGELAGAKLMPSNTPIYLALAIQDPGSSAVNYQLTFYPTTSRQP